MVVVATTEGGNVENPFSLSLFFVLVVAGGVGLSIHHYKLLFLFCYYCCCFFSVIHLLSNSIPANNPCIIPAYKPFIYMLDAVVVDYCW